VESLFFVLAVRVARYQVTSRQESFSFLLWDYEQRHSPSGHSAWPLDFRQIFKSSNDALQHLKSPFLMEHLASAEEYSELHLMSLFEKFAGVL